jgi:hypothetical protein
MTLATPGYGKPSLLSLNEVKELLRQFGKVNSAKVFINNFPGFVSSLKKEESFIFRCALSSQLVRLVAFLVLLQKEM